jgi:tetratricopeptide (TPR) repeat protein
LNVLPSIHPDIAVSYNNIAQVFVAMKNYDEAVKYFKKALAIEQSSFPPNHPSLGSTYNNLALALYDQQKLREALKYVTLSMEIHSKNFGPNHPLVKEDILWIVQLQEKIDQMEQKT